MGKDGWTGNVLNGNYCISNKSSLFNLQPATATLWARWVGRATALLDSVCASRAWQACNAIDARPATNRAARPLRPAFVSAAVRANPHAPVPFAEVPQSVALTEAKQHASYNGGGNSGDAKEDKGRFGVKTVAIKRRQHSGILHH